jgi:hypothetical protein
VPVADGRDGRHSQVLQFDDLLLLVGHWSSWRCRRTMWLPWWFLNLLG